jgi:hypothetical protein
VSPQGVEGTCSDRLTDCHELSTSKTALSKFTGLYVGGYPAHMLAMLYADLGDADIKPAIDAFALMTR